MRKLKILMVNLGFLPESVGGSEVYTYQLSRALIAMGHEVTVLAALDDLKQERFNVIRSTFEGIRVVKIVNSSLYARSFVDYFQNQHIDNLFETIVGETKPDLIHFQHLAYLSATLPEIAHKMNVPSLLTLHDYW